MRHIILAFILIWPLALAAQTLPALYDVRDVAADDVLNIRANASVGSHIIGALAPDQQAVEIIELSENKKWGLVNTSEQSGWASMRYLRPVGGRAWPSGQIPLYCFGTEPFWSLQIKPVSGNARFELMGETPEILLIKQFLQSARGYPPEIHIRFDNIGVNGANLTGNICSDQMSDRLYGIEAQIFSVSDDPLTPPSMGYGCCSLIP